MSGISAAEKYAELKARGEERPKCECHGVEMLWVRDAGRLGGGSWRCAERRRHQIRVSSARYRAANPEKVRDRNARYRSENIEKISASQARWISQNRDKRRAATARWRAKNPQIKMFGEVFTLPSIELVEFSRHLREQRKAELKEKSA